MHEKKAKISADKQGKNCNNAVKDKKVIQIEIRHRRDKPFLSSR